MYTINDDEIDFILNDIEKRGVVTEDVRYNILDHVCCIIENELPKGENFYEFYKNTIARFYLKELSEIERETNDLLTFKYYYAMKRTIKITGAVTAILTITGALFKVMHWPGAGVALVLGLAIFSLIFIPLNIIMKFRDDKKRSNRLIMVIGLLTAATGTIGILFKVMHWPFANVLVTGSLIVFLVLFIPVYFFTKFKDPETKFNAVIHSTFMIAACGMMFVLFNSRASKDITESIESLDKFQDENVEKLQTKNESLYNTFNSDRSENIDKIYNLTAGLNNIILAIKANLISKSNEISLDEAKLKTTNDLDRPNDYQVVVDHFEKPNGEFSYNTFKKAVNEYNEGISLLNEEQILTPIVIDDLQMTRTVVSLVLHELADIQILLLANENSYLSLNKGLLVER